MTLHATDVSEQKAVDVQDIPDDASVQEVLEAITRQMGLPLNDSEGRPLVYQALHVREGHHLRSDERVGDALQSGEKIVLQPNIDAGGGR
jgi:hypothetical protein